MIEETIKELTVAINNLTAEMKHRNEKVLKFAEQFEARPWLAPEKQTATPEPVVEKKPAATDTIAKLRAKAKAEVAAAKEEPAVIAYDPAAAAEAKVVIEKALEPAPAPEPVKPKSLDLADLTEVAQQILDYARGLDALRELNKRHGIERISKTPEDKLAAVHADLTALLAELSRK